MKNHISRGQFQWLISEHSRKGWFVGKQNDLRDRTPNRKEYTHYDFSTYWVTWNCILDLYCLMSNIIKHYEFKIQLRFSE